MALERLTVDRVIARRIGARRLESHLGQLGGHGTRLTALPVGVEHPDARGIEDRGLHPVERTDRLRLQTGLLGHGGDRTGHSLGRGVIAAQGHCPHEATEHHRGDHENGVRGAEESHPRAGVGLGVVRVLRWATISGLPAGERRRALIGPPATL